VVTDAPLPGTFLSCERIPFFTKEVEAADFLRAQTQSLLQRFTLRLFQARRQVCRLLLNICPEWWVTIRPIVQALLSFWDKG
jgi:hypothetical protein